MMSSDFSSTKTESFDISNIKGSAPDAFKNHILMVHSSVPKYFRDYFCADMAMRMTFPEICIDLDERSRGSTGKVKQICKVVVELTVEEGESSVNYVT